MALSQATYAAQVGTKVSLIFVIPKGYNTSDMSEIQSLAQSKGINTKVLNLLEVLDGRLLET
jgi:hypothetical protein